MDNMAFRIALTTLAIAPLIFGIPAIASSSIIELDQKEIHQLNMLTAEERQEQRCDMEAMAQIASADKTFNPDKVIAYTFRDPVVHADMIKAPGAVFRSKGEWYRLKYLCQTERDGLRVSSFEFTIGSRVHHHDWRRNYLYD